MGKKSVIRSKAIEAGKVGGCMASPGGYASRYYKPCGAPATRTLRNPVTGDMPEPMKICEKCYVTIADTWPRCV